jgi:ABC-type multidrug transport system ATPase subunit
MTQPALVVRADGRDTRVDGASTVTVGRDPACDVVLDHPLVSRRHVEVTAVDGHWTVRDLGSANGTFVGGQRVETLPLSVPLTVMLGHPVGGQVVELIPQDAPPPPPPTPAPGSQAAANAALHTGDRIRVGRAPDNDVVVDELLVSRHHAELQRTATGWELVDLASHNGTFVNGHRISRATVVPGDIVAVGLQLFEVVPDGLAPRGVATSVEFAAVDLFVQAKGNGPVLLDGVSFALAPCSLMAVVGPSGSGKSTLLGALTGARPASRGRVLYDGRDLYDALDELSGRMGMVPQDDILHPQLTVRRALEYGAELRFPPDTTAADRRARVDEVLAELELAHRADVVIERLSGGQRKRVSVALELLTRPSLLFLDEPTSGLDPGTERSLMELLRRLADGGRTIVVVTHSPQSLHLCDRVLYLAPGGRLGWFGPPGGAPAFFGCADEQEVFRQLSSDPQWPQRFREHDDCRRYVTMPLRLDDPGALTGIATPQRVPASGGSGRVGGWWRQWATLSRRYTAVLTADRRNLWLLVLQAPFLGLLLLVALPPGELRVLPLGQLRLVSRAPFVLFLIMVAVTWLGASNAVREIAKEFPILRRERAVGLSMSAYVGSKFAVLGVVTVAQAVVVTALALARQRGPRDAIVLGWPLAEVMLAAALTGLAALSLGLFLSAVAKTADRAMTLLPLVLVLQLMLAVGGIFPEVVDKPVLRQASYVSSTQWGFAAASATAELNRLALVNDVARNIPTIDLRDPVPVLAAVLGADLGDSRFNHEPRAWWSAIAAAVLLTLLGLVGTWLVLMRME